MPQSIRGSTVIPTAKPRTRVLFIVNVQNDFFGDGSNPISHADAALAAINRLRSKHWAYVFITGLQRPADHWCVCLGETMSCEHIVFKVSVLPGCSTFSSARPGSILASAAQHSAAGTPVGGAAPLLLGSPDTCVQGSWGAAFHAGLQLHESDVLVTYGYDPGSSGGSTQRASPSHCHSPPVCLDNGPAPTRPRAVSVLCDKARNPSSALQQLRDCEAQEVYFAGLCLDGAVAANALDLRAALPSVDVFVVEDACAASSPAAAAAVSCRRRCRRCHH